MTKTYRIIGVELSPYSVKVRSWFRYKQIPHEWIIRNMGNAELFQKYARLPLVPVVITPQDEGMQDSTPIIEKLELLHPEPSITPPGEVMPFISALLEEYADEWGNKQMFHYRWAYEPDQLSAAKRIAEMQSDDEAMQKQIAEAVRERMMPRRSFVGSSDETAAQIEASFVRLCGVLEGHLAGRDYIFGGRPSLADFGLWGQIYNAWTDPTPKDIIEARFPGLLRWIKQMKNPENKGEWEDWDSVALTLEPILSQEIAGLFFPWTIANAKALKAGKESFSVELEGQTFSQTPQKYHARSLAALRANYGAAKNPELDKVLEQTGCLSFLQA